MEKPLRVEPVTQEQVEALARVVGGMSAMISGLMDVDISRGRGVMDESGHRHCLWTTEGHRVSVSVDRRCYGIVASKSAEPDPEAPEPVK